MRQRAIDRGLRLNEYGLFHSQGGNARPEAAGDVPDRGGDVSRSSGLHYIPPEMREDMGESRWRKRGRCRA